MGSRWCVRGEIEEIWQGKRLLENFGQGKRLPCEIFARWKVTLRNFHKVNYSWCEIPYFDVLYSRIGCVTDDASYIDITFCLNLAFFYSLTLMFSMKHVVSPIRLRLCITQEVPLPPFIFFNRSWNIEDNVQLGWEESWGRKFCY